MPYVTRGLLLTTYRYSNKIILGYCTNFTPIQTSAAITIYFILLDVYSTKFEFFSQIITVDQLIQIVAQTSSVECVVEEESGIGSSGGDSGGDLGGDH